ncbi:hypothetical protein [Paraburkholderia fynbosensis]|uniref:Uncharacterized protein n=1 Tax=Paraburkholderia fynbosensis TaxID=1200993 RepID=A0A6J5FY56_9BURK|nr:hypothetical protein [Paraburkholderia fynbosensis]CAB3789108.1 hypothetical protein LMG27177_02556 [Paraburkholderia fynbosensis]
MISDPKYLIGEKIFPAGTIRCMLAVSVGFVLAATLEAKAEGRTISIVSGTYGQSCGALHGNVTREMAHRCNGRTTCEYLPRAPQKGRSTGACRNDFVAEWRCDSAEFHTAALGSAVRWGDTLVLSCVSERGAGK